MKKEFQIIAQLIENNTRVLDVGCGDGTLMKYLKDNKNIDTRGLEISKNNVQTCIGKGLAVIEGNAEKDLQQFPNLSFDYVVLSQTLQAFYNPDKVINDLLRVANKAIVTIPNFGYWKVRLQLLFKGTMPITKNLPDEWYNTPNLHMCTIKDFFNFCAKKNIQAKTNGIEVNAELTRKAIANGFNVVQGNAEEDLFQYSNQSFDYVILSQTLQAFYNPEKVIDDLLSLANKAIVTIPNFGYWKVRIHLLLKGTMPVTENLPNEWYNTPTLHMCTIKDFFNFCSKKKIELYKSIALNGEKTSKINSGNINIKNLSSELGIFLIKK